MSKASRQYAAAKAERAWADDLAKQAAEVNRHLAEHANDPAWVARKADPEYQKLKAEWEQANKLGKTWEERRSLLASMRELTEDYGIATYAAVAGGAAVAGPEKLPDASVDAGNGVGDGNDKPTHGPNFESICWGGETFIFNRAQSVAVKLLYENWEKGKLAVRQSAIGAAINSGATDYRVEHTFRARDGSAHPAWGTLIVKAGTPGTYTLTKPESQKKDISRPRTRTTTRRQSGHVKRGKT